MNYNQAQVYGGNREPNFHYLGNQTLQYGEQFQLELSCPFNFTKFPFDSKVSFFYSLLFNLFESPQQLTFCDAPLSSCSQEQEEEQ